MRQIRRRRLGSPEATTSGLPREPGPVVKRSGTVPRRGLVRRVVGAPRRLTRGLLGYWRRSITFRVVGATLALSVTVLILLGQLLMGGVRDGLVSAKVSASLAQADTGFASAQAKLDAAGTLQRADVGQLLTQVVTGLRDAAGSSSLYELVLIPSPNSEADVPAARLRVATGGVRPDSVTAALMKAVTDAAGGRVQQFLALCYGPTDDPCPPKGPRVPALVAGRQFTIAGAGTYQLYFLFPMTGEQKTLALVRSRLAVAGGSLLVLLGAIAFLVTRSTVKPVRAAARVAERLASGRLAERMVEQGEDDLARLASSFNGMASALQRQIRQLEDLSAVQQQFVSDVSHELRTPLTTIRMAADVLYEQREDFTAPVARSAELMHDQLDRFEALLTELLEISRFDAGAAVLDPESTDLRDLVRRVVDGIEPLAAGEYGCRIVVLEPDRDAVADIDPRRIERVLRNLLLNAVEHGEGRDVQVIVGADDFAVAVAVRDQGIGLREGEAALVFNRFWRADPSRARRTGGTGLGLSIARGDAQLHGGWLQAWGRPHAGAVFRLTLPRTVGGVLHGSPVYLEPPRSSGAVPHDAGPASLESPDRGRTQREGLRGPESGRGEVDHVGSEQVGHNRGPDAI
ncbi:MAG TPA: MtrAB system histidine kinase MtrB [Sporichthyaceae bacterium]|jgi:two-component system sensor histidine kinase MtrB|nr:MtrAB system histidine kinase MtrB [Sporichthyaceae bacterium]